MYILNNNGLRTEPWGTPEPTSKRSIYNLYYIVAVTPESYIAMVPILLFGTQVQ